jgi:hypothetical protein
MQSDGGSQGLGHVSSRNTPQARRRALAAFRTTLRALRTTAARRLQACRMTQQSTNRAAARRDMTARVRHWAGPVVVNSPSTINGRCGVERTGRTRSRGHTTGWIDPGAGHRNGEPASGFASHRNHHLHRAGLASGQRSLFFFAFTRHTGTQQSPYSGPAAYSVRHDTESGVVGMRPQSPTTTARVAPEISGFSVPLRRGFFTRKIGDVQ